VDLTPALHHDFVAQLSGQGEVQAAVGVKVGKLPARQESLPRPFGVRRLEQERSDTRRRGPVRALDHARERAGPLVQPLPEGDSPALGQLLVGIRGRGARWSTPACPKDLRLASVFQHLSSFSRLG